MGDKTNIERLEEAGILDSSDMSQEHKDVINNDMTHEEILGLMVSHRAKSRFNTDPWKPDADGGGF